MDPSEVGNASYPGGKFGGRSGGQSGLLVRTFGPDRSSPIIVLLSTGFNRTGPVC